VTDLESPWISGNMHTDVSVNMSLQLPTLTVTLVIGW